MKGNLKYTIVRRSTKIIRMDTSSCQSPWFSHVTILSFFCKKTCLTTSQCLPSTASFIGELPSASGKFNWPTWQFCLQKPGNFVFFSRPFCHLPLEEKSMAALRFHPSSARWTWPIRMSPVSPGIHGANPNLKEYRKMPLNSNSASVSRNQWKVH